MTWAVPEGFAFASEVGPDEAGVLLGGTVPRCDDAGGAFVADCVGELVPSVGGSAPEFPD